MLLLEGIRPEAADLLKDRRFAIEVSRASETMDSTRQIECIELTISTNAIAVASGEAMLPPPLPLKFWSRQKSRRS
ncbi:hypothetical protein [Collimonas antrihumi]|uniref:hypothetical protein n=1 Tax=Collimonas antrihumi TaxID=1940615 RepID=UPI001B8AA6C9|nr:hypothetical protein [Collimonas antrihumi]